MLAKSHKKLFLVFEKDWWSFSVEMHICKMTVGIVMKY